MLNRIGVDFKAKLYTDSGWEEIDRVIAAEGLEGKVYAAAETMDGILNRYADADVSVIPTLWSEGTSLSCVEALAAGVPVVATPVGGLGNIVIPGFNGFISAPTADAIAEAINLLADIRRWNEMHRNCLYLRDSMSQSKWQERIISWLEN